MQRLIPRISPPAFLLALVVSAGCSKDEPATIEPSKPIFSTVSGEAVSFTDYAQTVDVRGVEHLVVVDEASGDLAWRAMVCDLLECAGRGHDGEAPLFAYKHTSVAVGNAGKPDWSVVSVDDMAVVERFCPFCNRTEGVKPYISKGTQQQRERLEKELSRIRAIRDQDEREGRTPRGTRRTPNAIMDDMANLPKTFLIEKRAISN